MPILAIAAFAVLLAAFPLWLLVRALRMGQWNGRGIDVARSERPLAFWFGIAGYAVIAAIILSAPIILEMTALG